MRSPKVSVVVPVYNPGPDIEPLINSLFAQTMAPEDREFIFVDDGSTDGTGARLGRLGAEHDEVHVVHIPNSGWPGRPRNIGIERASGEFMFFADNDDWLADDALELLYACAVRHRADIVIGKVVGHGRHIPHMFTKDRHGLDAADAPLSLLTPHKLFRTAMVREHGIRFPEGRRRLEDHLFVVPAYFAAERISVLAGHPIYHWVRRSRDRGASRQWPDLEGHFTSLRELLSIVDERTLPGTVRDRYYLHWYRVKVLKRLGRASGHQADAAHRAEFFDRATRLIQERIPPRLDDQLPFNFRLRALLARRGDLGGLERLRAFESDVRTNARVDTTGAHVRVTGDLRARGEPAIRIEPVNDRLLWVPPAELNGLWDEPERDVTSALEPQLRIVLRSRQDAGDWVFQAPSAVDLPGRRTAPAKLHAELDLGAAIAAASVSPPPGLYGVRLAMSLAGFLHEAPVRFDGDPLTITVTPDGHPRASHRSATTGRAPASQPRRLGQLIARAARPLRRG